MHDTATIDRPCTMDDGMTLAAIALAVCNEGVIACAILHVK